MKRINDFLSSQGSLPAIQLAHAGRKASMQRHWLGNGPLDQADHARGELVWESVAHGNEPIGPGWLVPHELSHEELKAVRQAFVAAAVRAAWPAERPLFYRISAIDDVEGGWTIEDSVCLAGGLKALGIDVVDCSSGGIGGSATAAQKPLTPRVPGFQLPFAAQIRRASGIKTMAVGLIPDGALAEAALQSGQTDLIAIGREALNNPHWPLHAAQALGIDPDFGLWPEQYGW